MPDLLTVPSFPRAANYAGAWAIEPGAGAALWERARGQNLAVHVASAKPPALTADVQKIPTQDKGGAIGVVVLAGTLMKAQSSMDESTSTVDARRQIRKAANDPEVSGILLWIDSPGGTVSGTADLAAEVAAAALKKPVYAYAEDLAASAAYWVASQADKVFANTPTAMIGSIGTLLVVYDLSGAAEAEGIKPLVFGTGPLKGTGVEGAPITEEQQAYLAGLVRETQVSFDAAVKKGRRLTDAKLADVKTGGVFLAQEAMALGLIDGIKGFDAVVADLAAEAKRRSKGQQTTRAESPILNRSATMNETTTATLPDAADPVATMRAQAAAEADRIAGIQRVAANHPAIIAEAIRSGWSVEKTENTAMRKDLDAATAGVGATNPGGPAMIFRRGPNGGPAVAAGVTANDAIEAAMCRSLGSRGIETRYRPEVLQAADDHFRGIRLQSVFLMAAQQGGYNCRPGERITQSNFMEVMRHAFAPPSLSASGGFSTVSLPGILSHTANSELLAGFVEVDQTWREVAAIKSVSDFKQVTSYRLLDNMEYEELPPAGKIKHGSVSEESYTRQIKTYAKMFVLTRQAIINDDLGAFSDLRTLLGRGSAKAFNNVFWTKFLYDHATFFTAGRTNYISGATTNLGIDGVGLGLGEAAFYKMTSPAADGAKRIGGRPEILLVPPELSGAAETLYKNQNLGSGIPNSSANIFAGKYRPVVVPWLSDPAFTGYSTTAWYLLRNPGDLPMMVASFLDGQQTPTVESEATDFDTLGVQFRGYHDFGADQAEYLAGVKSKGAA